MSLAVPCSGHSADVPDIHPVNTNKMPWMVMMLFLISFKSINHHAQYFPTHFKYFV